MPELPEVEALRRGLEPLLKGRRVIDVQVFKPKLVSSKSNKRVEDLSKVEEFINGITGETFMAVKRRAKNLVFYFESGRIMLVHLKMTGQMVYKFGDSQVWAGHPIELSHSQLPNKHSHIIFTLDQGVLYYNDTRMFGYCLFFEDDTVLDEHFQGLGLEPLSNDFTVDYLANCLTKCKKGIKSILLEQKVVVGLGNIYADEACFAAGILPIRSANTLTKTEIVKLHAVIMDIIPKAISEGGSSVANYLLADGTSGNYAHYHKVYLKGGTKCQNCGNILSKGKVAQRTTVYCLKCQK